MYKVCFYGTSHVRTSPPSVYFPFLFRRTRHGCVEQRSGTGLETPLLGWALPLKILNHKRLGVDVPVFLHPDDVTSFRMSSLDFLCHLFGHLMLNSVTNLLVIQALLFNLGSTQSQIFRLCKVLSVPALLPGGC